jgi:hypothetical protein
MIGCRLTSTTSIQSPVMPSDLTSDRGGVPIERFFKTGDPDVTSSDACPSLTRFRSEFILCLYYLRLVPVVSKMKERKGIQSTEYSSELILYLDFSSSLACTNSSNTAYIRVWHLVPYLGSDAFHLWPPLLINSRDYHRGSSVFYHQPSTTNSEHLGVKEGMMTDDHLGLPRNDSRPNSPSVHKMPSSDAMRSDEDDMV